MAPTPITLEKATWLHLDELPGYTAAEDRGLIAAISGRAFGTISTTTRLRSHGILGRQTTGTSTATEPTGDLTVKAKSSPALSVDVTVGRGLVSGNQVSNAGVWAAQNQTVKTFTGISPGHATNPRIDRVVLTIRSAEYPAYTNDDAVLQYLEGTPAGSPTAPAIPEDSISLATISVAALASNVTAPNITNAGPTAGLFSGVMPVADYADADAVSGKRSGDLFVEPSGLMWVQLKDGLLAPATRVGCIFYRNADQNINTTTADIAWDAVTRFPSSMTTSWWWDIGDPTKMKCRWPGFYGISGTMQSHLPDGTANWNVGVHETSDSGSFVTREVGTAQYHNPHMSGYWMDSGGYFRIRVQSFNNANYRTQFGKGMRFFYEAPLDT